MLEFIKIITKAAKAVRRGRHSVIAVTGETLAFIRNMDKGHMVAGDWPVSQEFHAIKLWTNCSKSSNNKHLLTL